MLFFFRHFFASDKEMSITMAVTGDLTGKIAIKPIQSERELAPEGHWVMIQVVGSWSGMWKTHIEFMAQ